MFGWIFDVGMGQTMSKTHDANFVGDEPPFANCQFALTHYHVKFSMVLLWRVEMSEVVFWPISYACLLL